MGPLRRRPSNGCFAWATCPLERWRPFGAFGRDRERARYDRTLQAFLMSSARVRIERKLSESERGHQFPCQSSELERRALVSSVAHLTDSEQMVLIVE